MKTFTHSNYKGEDKTELSSLWYGDIREDKNGDLVFVPFTTYSDYSGSTVERSNCNVFLSEFDQDTDQYSGKIWEVYGGYSTRGVIILKSLFDKDKEIQEIFDSLEDYPLINEDDLSFLEMELEDESWGTWIKFDLERLLEKNDISFDENKIQDQFYNILREHDIYFIHEDAVSPYIDLDEVLKVWNVKNED